MNPISNIWNHPKTSAAGVLIAVVTIAGVLSQQGISLGNVGSGTVVALVSGLATALLGLLARDPQPALLPQALRPSWALGADRPFVATAFCEWLLGNYRGAGHRQLDAGSCRAQ